MGTVDQQRDPVRPERDNDDGADHGLVGYARVSTIDQDLALQHDALAVAGCGRVFSDRRTGADAGRPQLAAALDFLRPGDTLVVWKLDRLGRSLRDLIEQVRELEARGVGFRSLTENIDTTTPGGRLVFHIFGALAEFERGLIRERTMAGLEAARARGRRGGRPRALSDEAVQVARELRERDQTLDEIAATLKVGRATLVRALARDAEDRLARPSSPGEEPR